MAVQETQTTSMNALGKTQVAIEDATKELKLAQATFERAQERLKLAKKKKICNNIDNVADRD